MSNVSPAIRGESAAAACSSERFLCRFSQGMFAWSYHDGRGRLLVAGPAHADLWRAHRLLLLAVQEAALAGPSPAEEDEEETFGGEDLDGSIGCEGGAAPSANQEPVEPAA